jgi:predicted MFS family arabinose efflux permease
MPPVRTSNKRSRRAVLTVAIGSIALETSLLGMVAPLLPEIEMRTGAGDEALALALAAYAIPILVTSIPVGRLADRIGRRPLLLGGLVLTGIGSILIATSGSLGPLLAGRAVQGFGSTLSWVAALALVSDLARPGRKGEALGFAFAANSLGAVGGPALGGVAGGVISFEAPFILVTVIAAVTFMAGFAVLPRTEHLSKRVAQPSTLRLLLRRAAIVPAAASATGATVLGMIDFVVPLDLDRRLAISATAIGLIFAAIALIDAIAAPPAGAAGDRLGRRPVALAGASTMAISGILLTSLGGLAGTCGALAILAVGLSVTFAAAAPWLDETFGESDRGLAYGGLNLIFALGYTIGPIVGGWLLAGSGADSAYLLIAVTSVLLAIVLAIPAGRRQI